MANEGFEMEGIVTDKIKGGQFKVKLSNGHEMICTISGKLRMNYISILVGDKVTVNVTPYDLTKGRIIWRHK